MSVVTERVAHPELVGGGQTAKHSHAGGGGALSYTNLDGSVNTTALSEGASDGAWVTWDLSGALPVGTVAADIAVWKLAASDVAGIRKNGSALARQLSCLKSSNTIFPSEVGAARMLEIMSGDVSDEDVFRLMGYWS